jgi:hypothetical protein
MGSIHTFQPTTKTCNQCCCIIDKYNKVINILTYKFSKEQCMLPEDDLRIETCRSILSVLV